MATSAKYDVEAVSVEQLLAPESVALKIPPFQRRYSWSTTEVNQLVQDLFDDEEWIAQDGQEVPYFLGSIVLAEGDGVGLLILDGQQRLTTISLLLAVLKQKLDEQGHGDTAEIQKYLVSGEFGKKKRPKLTLQPEDKETYLALVRNPSSHSTDKVKRNSLAKAVKGIDQAVDEYVAEAARLGKGLIESYEEMARKVMYGVEFVRIVAPTESEAFRLFETLNDRGLALNAADLIKNKLFAQCGEEYLEEIIDVWGDIVDLVGETEIVNFLRYHWIADEGHVRKRRLYDSYRQKLDSMDPLRAGDYAYEIRTAAEIYQHLVDPKPESTPWTPETAESLQRLVAFRARSCRPLLLVCAKQAPSHFPVIAKLCETITVRYSMVGERNPNLLEKAYSKLCGRIRQAESGTPQVIDAALPELFDQVPDDEEFAAKFAEIELNRITKAWRTVLARLNDFAGTGEVRVKGPRKVHVEHVLPKRPRMDALREATLTKDEVEVFCNQIGNLTLLSGRLNRSISNGPYSEKRFAFADSEIALNDWIAKQEYWTVREIEERSRLMARLALQAWPWPIRIGESSGSKEW